MKSLISFLLAAALVLACAAGCSPPETPPEISAVGQPSSSHVAASEPVTEDEPVADEQITPEPVDAKWELGDPALLGVDAEHLAGIHQRIAASEMLAAVIVKDGVIIDEFYRDGYDESSLFRMHSVTKSVMGALIGIAIDKGIISGVDVRLNEIYPGLNNPGNEGKENITIEHLLLHTSGLGEGDSGQSFQKHVRSENWVERFLSLPLAHEPGAAFFYSTAGSHMLSDVLEKSAGISTYDFAVENLFGPLGIESFDWGRDPQGVVDGGNGLLLNVRDAAKLGQLYLEGGSWRGNQLVPREWIEKSILPKAPGEPDKGQYGYQWWIKSFGGRDVYYALGYAGQFIFVVPDLKLVAAIASKSIWSDYTGQVCIRDLIGACGAGL